VELFTGNRRAEAAPPAGVAAVALSLLQFVDVLSNTVVITVLPRMLTDVHAPASASSLVATGYAMLFGGLLMFASRAADLIGHRRAVLVSLLVFGLGAVVAGLAGSVVVLIVGRALQGVGAALAVPAALSILTRMNTEPQRRDRALAVWSAAGAAGGAGGFVVGGIVSGLASWRWIFAGMLIVTVILAATILITVPPDTDRQDHLRLNPASSLLLTGSVMAVVVATTLLPSGHWPTGVGLLLLTPALLAALRVLDRRSAAPLLPADVLHQPQLRRGVLGSVINTATTSSAITLLTLYLQDSLHHGPLLTAALLLPFSLAVIAGSSFAPTAIRKLQREKTIAVGHATIAASLLLLTLEPDQFLGVACSTALAGAGIGIASVPATSLGTDVAGRHRATASGLVNTGTQLGTAVGTAVLLLVAATTTRIPSATTPPPRPAWALATGLALLGAVVFATRKDVRRVPR